jgi:glycerol-3-phosphate dehydrogenase (NAD(P)+)
MSDKRRVAILGGGSFGTALANIVADNGHHACLWLRNVTDAEEINQRHINARYLPDYPLNNNLKATTDLAAATANANIVFMAVPSKSCREVAKELAKVINPAAMLISTTKGIEPTQFKLMSEVLAEELPDQRLGVMSGPNLAKEIAARQLTATVIASRDDVLNKTVQVLLGCGYFRVYTSNDAYGVELGGALKNVYALMAGMANALGIGQNTISMLLTRALAEMGRFAVSRGADPMTFLGLAGVGDLIVTCMSPLSRNYQVGYALGKGKKLEEIVVELGQVAEGVNTLRLVKQEADLRQVRMPLVNGLYDILYNEKTIQDVVGSLMWAEQSKDVEFVV